MVHLCRSSRDTILKNLNRHYKLVVSQSWPACRSSKYLRLRPSPALILAPKIDTIYLSARSEFNVMALVDNGSDDLRLAKFLQSLDETSVERVAISVSLLYRPGASRYGLRNLIMGVLFFSSRIREIVFVLENDVPPEYCPWDTFWVQNTEVLLGRIASCHKEWKEGRSNRFLKIWPRSTPLVFNHRPSTKQPHGLHRRSRA